MDSGNWDGLSFDPAGGALAAGGTADPAAALSAAAYQQDFYLPLHALGQAWITNPFGRLIDGLINSQYFASHPEARGEFCGLICNGTAGTAAHPDGGNGGLWDGDGGAGWNSTEPGVAGGKGGTAEGFDNDGNGGAAAAGGHGGDGGNGGNAGPDGAVGQLGGNGGNGGADGTPGTAGADGANAPGAAS